MKKVLTAMTAMSMTLQASEQINENIDFQDFPENESEGGLLDSENGIYKASQHDQLMGASGTYLQVYQYNTLLVDFDGTGRIHPGDVMVHNVDIVNDEFINASGVFYLADVHARTQLMTNSVVHSQGNEISGNSPLDPFVAVDVGDISQGANATLSYQFEILPVPDGVVWTFLHNGEVTESTVFVQNDVYSQVTHKIYGEPVVSLDEATDGDITDHLQMPLTELNLSAELDMVRGVVGGVGIDLEDCFQFEVGPERGFASVILQQIELTPDNPSLLFQLYSGLPPVKSPVGNLANVELTEHFEGHYLFNPSINFNPGLYSICMIDSIPGQSYSLVIETDLTDLIFSSNFD